MARFDLNNYLSVRKDAVERALLAHLGRDAAESQTIWQVMRYGLFPGGKRIRPILLLAAGELFSGHRAVLMPFACAGGSQALRVDNEIFEQEIHP